MPDLAVLNSAELEESPMSETVDTNQHLSLVERVGVVDWGSSLKPLLRTGAGDACLALLLFSRETPIRAFPVPTFSPEDRKDMLGLVPLAGSSPDPEAAFEFDPRSHLLPLTPSGHIEDGGVVMGLVARSRDKLTSYVRAWSARAKSLPDCAEAMAGVSCVIVTGFVP